MPQTDRGEASTMPAGKALVIAILFNPISGSGRAHAAADAIRQALERDGFEVRLIPTQRERADLWLRPLLAGVTAMIIAGGDGALKSVVQEAVRADVAIWHAPCGTENLFAKSFGMSREPSEISRALRVGRTRRVDVGSAVVCAPGSAAEDVAVATAVDTAVDAAVDAAVDTAVVSTAAVTFQPFTIMASVGFDAEVVHALGSMRRGAITYLSYVRPIIGALSRWRPAHLAWVIDGKREELGRGVVIVANLPRYALALNPAAQAVADDGLLTAVFVPARHGCEVLLWLPILWTRLHRQWLPLHSACGSNVHVIASAPQRLQLDGDPASGPVTEVRFSVQPSALRVLVPS